MHSSWSTHAKDTQAFTIEVGLVATEPLSGGNDSALGRDKYVCLSLLMSTNTCTPGGDLPWEDSGLPFNV